MILDQFLTARVPEMEQYLNQKIVPEDGTWYKTLRLTELRTYSGIGRMLFGGDGTPEILAGATSKVTSLKMEMGMTCQAFFDLKFKKDFKTSKGMLVIAGTLNLLRVGVSIIPTYLTEAAKDEPITAVIRAFRTVQFDEGYPIARMYFIPFVEQTSSKKKVSKKEEIVESAEA